MAPRRKSTTPLSPDNAHVSLTNMMIGANPVIPRPTRHGPSAPTYAPAAASGWGFPPSWVPYRDDQQWSNPYVTHAARTHPQRQMGPDKIPPAQVQNSTGSESNVDTTDDSATSTKKSKKKKKQDTKGKPKS